MTHDGCVLDWLALEEEKWIEIKFEKKTHVVLLNFFQNKRLPPLIACIFNLRLAGHRKMNARFYGFHFPPFHLCVVNQRTAAPPSEKWTDRVIVVVHLLDTSHNGSVELSCRKGWGQRKIILINLITRPVWMNEWRARMENNIKSHITAGH